jgi:hypothetical protein
MFSLAGPLVARAWGDERAGVLIQVGVGAAGASGGVGDGVGFPPLPSGSQTQP